MTDTQVSQPTASKDPSPALAFTLDRLRMDPDTTFLSIRDAAKLAGLVIYPIVFAKARGMLGLGPLLQYRRRVPREEPPELARNGPELIHEPNTLRAANDATELQPARAEDLLSAEPPLVNASSVAEQAIKQPRKMTRTTRPTATQTLDTLVAYVRSIEDERDRLRAALEEIARVLQEVDLAP